MDTKLSNSWATMDDDTCFANTGGAFEFGGKTFEISPPKMAILATEECCSKEDVIDSVGATLQNIGRRNYSELEYKTLHILALQFMRGNEYVDMKQLNKIIERFGQNVKDNLDLAFRGLVVVIPFMVKSDDNSEAISERVRTWTTSRPVQVLSYMLQLCLRAMTMLAAQDEGGDDLERELHRTILHIFPKKYNHLVDTELHSLCGILQRCIISRRTKT